MKTVHRTKGIRKLFREIVCRETVQKYVTAGDRACARLKREARPRQRDPGPSDTAILAWAVFDLSREIMGGFWDIKAA